MRPAGWPIMVGDAQRGPRGSCYALLIPVCGRFYIPNTLQSQRVTSMDATMVFLIGSVALLVGFTADYLFRRYKAPDVLILIAFGAALGPAFTGLINESMAQSMTVLTPYVATLALVVIMFHAGMGLHIREVLTSLNRALVQTVVAFMISLALVAGICFFALRWDLMTSLLMGAILGGTSAAIVIPLINGLKVSGNAKIILTLESAIVDVLSVIVAMVLIGVILSGKADLGGIAVMMVSTFLISILAGFVAGLIWLKVLSRLSGKPFSYMVTLGVMLGVYAMTEVLVGGTGGGTLAALVFGLTLSNGEELASILRRDARNYVCDEHISTLHDEITFFVRTFFFIYLGIVVTTMSVTMFHIAAGVTMSVAIILGRYLCTRHFSRRLVSTKIDREAMMFMMPRGLCAAVLASLPLSMGAVSVEMGEAIMGAVTIVILITTAVASFGAFYMHRGLAKEEKAAELATLSPPAEGPSGGQA